jgi:hypothetical protein
MTDALARLTPVQLIATLQKVLGPKWPSIEAIAQGISDPAAREHWLRNLLGSLASGDMRRMADMTVYKHTPVDIRTFIEDPYFLDKKGTVYPKIMEELEELASGKYIEAVFTGGIGSGKTTAAHYAIAYQLFILSCMRDPHKFFSLDSASEILYVFQSLSATHAKALEYNRFRSLMESSHYFKDVWPFDKDIESKLVFPNRIEVLPLSGQETAAIGQNVMGGILDEVNYMAVIEKSKASVDGGSYDQAWALYNSIARRRKSRFIKGGKTYGMLCLVSSKRFPGQFTDIKEEESKQQIAERGSTNIFIYDKRAWEVKPKGSYSDDTFLVFIGDEFRKPRVLESLAGLTAEDRALVMPIPVEYKTEFQKDITNALREIAGVSTLAKHPYILDTEALARCMRPDYLSVLSDVMTDFQAYKIKAFKNRIVDGHKPRWVHIDLSVSGIACGHVSGFKNIDRGDCIETWPEITADFTLEVAPPQGGEILFYRIREMLYKLRGMGLNIKWVSFDSFQSVDSLQTLRQQGFITGMRSMDTNLTPYALLKAAIYDGRLRLPEHPRLRRELLSVEYDPKKSKIDHPSTGSKDCADALAGVVVGLTQQMSIWLEHDISPVNIPPSVREPKKADANKTKGEQADA